MPFGEGVMTRHHAYQRIAFLATIVLTGLVPSLGMAQSSAQEEGEFARDVIARVKQEWSLHPGPLMVDANDWLPNETVMDGDRVIREPDLKVIAQAGKRRYIQVGRADVFARRLEVSPSLRMGRPHSLYAFASQRFDALLEGLPLNQFTADERELWTDVGFSSPAFLHALRNNSTAPMVLSASMSWMENGQLRSVGGFRIHEAVVNAPTGNPAWAAPRAVPQPEALTLDFGGGEMLTTRELIGRVAELGYSVRYDARLEGSPIFVKGTFEVGEILESLREVLQTIPMSAQDLRAQRNHMPARYREMLVAALIKRGFPPSLAERLELPTATMVYEIVATKKEFREVEPLKARMSSEESEADQVIRMEVGLRFWCDPGFIWSSLRADGITVSQGALSHGLPAP